MPELLGSKKNIIEDLRNQIRVLSNEGNVRVTAELQLKNGDRRIYRAKSIDRNSAIREIIKFVAAIEKTTGESVLWRLKGEKTYHLGTNFTSKKPSVKRTFDSFVNYFFGLED